MSPDHAAVPTVDHCFVLVDETTSREHAYTAMSRGRHGNELYVDSPITRDGESHADEIKPDELDGLRRNLGRSTRQKLAIDRVQPTPMYAAPVLDIDDGIGW